MPPIARRRLVLALTATVAAAVVAAGPAAPQGGQPTPNLAPYMATPQEVVDRMLQMAEVTKGDVVYDLGSGDGRLVITAAKRYGARGVGIDIDPALITQSRANARKEGVESLVEFRQQDALDRRRLARQRGDALPAQRRQPEAAADAAEAAQAGLADRLAPVRDGRLGPDPDRDDHRPARHVTAALSLDHRPVMTAFVLDPKLDADTHRDHHAAPLPWCG